MTKKTLAFDIDGTLIDRKGELFPGVFPIFENKKITDCNLIFATGNFQSTTQALWDRLVFHFPHMKDMKPYFITATGAMIYGRDGQELFKHCLDKDKILKVTKQLCEIAPLSVLAFGKDDTMFHIPYPKTEELASSIEEFIEHEKSKKIGIPITTGPKTAKQIIMEDGDILNAIVLHSTQRERILDLLIEEFGNDECGIYQAKFLDIITLTARTKWTALKTLVEHEKKQPASHFAKDAKDIYYFGDDVNDIECLQKCTFSVARGGDNLDADAIAAAKYHADDLTEITKMIFGDE